MDLTSATEEDEATSEAISDMLYSCYDGLENIVKRKERERSVYAF